MKNLIIVSALFALALATACQRSMPPVPPSSRPVVGPQGSTNIKKPWNETTKHEGDSVLGPLSNMRR